MYMCIWWWVRGPKGPRARRARTQNQKIENFNSLVTRPGWIDQKTRNFEKFDFLGLVTRPETQKSQNFEIFNFWACYPALKTKKVEISKFSIFLLTRHSTRPQKSEISKISMDRTPPHDQGAHPWKKKAPAQLPIHLLPHCPHSVHWWLSCHCSSVLSVLC